MIPFLLIIIIIILLGGGGLILGLTALAFWLGLAIIALIILAIFWEPIKALSLLIGGLFITWYLITSFIQIIKNNDYIQIRIKYLLDKFDIGRGDKK
jgi:uncharacterized membrane protein YkvI